MSLVQITIPELKELQEIYKVDWPLHIITHNTIKSFVHRFEKSPEWKAFVTFWSLNGDWKKNGTFVMVNKQMIFFNTLESAPHDEIKEVLMKLQYDKNMMFINTREIFKSLVYDVIEKLQLKILFDKACTCFFIPKENYKGMKIT